MEIVELGVYDNLLCWPPQGEPEVGPMAHTQEQLRMAVVSYGSSRPGSQFGSLYWLRKEAQTPYARALSSILAKVCPAASQSVGRHPRCPR